MENDILDALTDMGYTGPLLDKDKLMQAVNGGAKDVEFTTLISYLAKELRSVCNIDEHVNSIKAPEDSISFLLELSSFLKELGCPYINLTQGHISDRLTTDYDKLLLVEYLISELMAAQMNKANNPDTNIQLKLEETPVAADLKQLLLALKFNKPPPNITPAMLFQKAIPKLQETVKQAGEDLVGKPLFSGTLSDSQWRILAHISTELDAEYTIRREMLLKRLDCTIQSFQWSDRLKGKEDQIVQIYHNKRKLLKVDPGIDISDVLAAREDLAIIEKTSNASVRKNTKSALNKLIIGRVPDRGGRPAEQAPPPAEMPSWQQRAPAGPGVGASGRPRGKFYPGKETRQFNIGDNRTSHNQPGMAGCGHNQPAMSSGYVSPNLIRGGAYFGYGNRGNNSTGGRSYESFQHNKISYADQYVQDSQHNHQHYGGRGRDNDDSPRGQRRGRHNYNRGNYR